MAQLDMSKADYGRNTKGAQSLLAIEEQRVSAAIKALKGESYKAVVNAVQANWSGADADAFLKKFEEKVNSLNEKFTGYYGLIQNAIDEDAKGFAQMQSSNIDLFK